MSLRALWRHLVLVLRNESDEKGTLLHSFVTSCNEGKWFCNTLLTAGIYELEPGSGGVLVSAETGGNIGNVADFFGSKGSSIFPADRKEEFKMRLTEKKYLAPGPISTFAIPMNVNWNHWGMFVAKQVDGDNWILYWGDSLREKASDARMRFVVAVIEHALEKRLKWEISSRNYMLDILGYEQQRDSHSCGAYVVSAMSHLSRTRGVLPVNTFLKYSPNLTEKYRWAASECRLRVILGARSMGWTITDEFVINGMHDNAREERYAKRHQRVVHETMRYSKNKVAHAKFLEGGALISNTENYFEVLGDHGEDPGLKVTRTVGSIRGTGGTGSSQERGRSKTRSNEKLGTCIGKRRESHGKGSKKEIRKNLNADKEQRGEGCARKVTKEPTADTEERGEGSTMEVTNDFCVDMVGDEAEEKVVGAGTKTGKLTSSHTFVENLPEYLYELMKEGYGYGVHLRRHIARVRQYRFTTRVRCMRHKQYPKGTGCKAGIVAKLLTDMRGWVVTGENSHNHERASMSNKAIDMRVSAIRNSIKKCCPKTLRIPYFHYTPKKAQGAKQLEEQKSGLEELPQSQIAKKREVTIISDSDDDFMSGTSRPPAPRLSPHRTAPRIVDLDSSGGTEDRNELQDAMDVNEEVLDEGRASEDTDECFSEDVVQSGNCAKKGVGCRTAEEDGEVQDYSFQRSLDEEECVRDGFAAYLTSVQGTTEDETLKHLQYIAECFGFHLHVRDSVYKDKPGERTLKRGSLVCALRRDKRFECTYTFKLHRVRIISDENNEKAGEWGFRYDLSKAHHNHSPNQNRFHKKLPPQMEREAYHLYDRLRLQYTDILRILEDRYGLKVDKELFRKRLKYLSDTRNPKDKEAVRLYENLLQLQADNASNAVYCTTNENNNLHYVAWSFEQWILDYQQYGLVPGVSVDCKAVANRFGIPLFTINGRDNYGHVTTFFMGFLPDETTESFTWILTKFKECVKVSPSCVVLDQSQACLAALRTVFPTSYLTFDDWHLNQNQATNVPRWCAKINRSNWNDEMQTELYSLRASSSIEIFRTRRAEFDRKYFTNFNQPLPKWYKYLYHENPMMLILCYKQVYLPKRFLFQGTGYTESSNHRYQKLVLGRRVPLSEVPLEMSRITSRLKEERKVRNTGDQTALCNKLATAQLPLTTKAREELVARVTPYAIKKFLTTSVKKAPLYYISNVSVQRCMDTDWRNFEVDREDLNLEDTQAITIVTVDRIPSNLYPNAVESQLVLLYSHGATLHGCCTCDRFSSDGLPCSHITRISTVYNDICQRWPDIASVVGHRFRLEELFHPYWFRESSSWCMDDILSLRSKMGAIGVQVLGEIEDLRRSSVPNETTANRIEELLNGRTLDQYLNEIHEERKRELTKLTSWSNCRGIMEQMHRVADGYGPTALLRLHQYLKVGLARLNAGKDPCDNVALISSSEDHTRKLNTVLDAAQEPQDANMSKVVNPNEGKYKQRRRKKSNLEKAGSTKKRNKSVGTDPASQNIGINETREQANTALTMAVAIVDHPDRQYASMRSAEK